MVAKCVLPLLRRDATQEGVDANSFCREMKQVNSVQSSLEHYRFIKDNLRTIVHYCGGLWSDMHDDPRYISEDICRYVSAFRIYCTK